MISNQNGFATHTDIYQTLASGDISVTLAKGFGAQVQRSFATECQIITENSLQTAVTGDKSRFFAEKLAQNDSCRDLLFDFVNYLN